MAKWYHFLIYQKIVLNIHCFHVTFRMTKEYRKMVAQDTYFLGAEEEKVVNAHYNLKLTGKRRATGRIFGENVFLHRQCGNNQLAKGQRI